MKFESISRLAMKFVIVLLATNILAIRVPAQRNGATNPIIFADVPDMSIIRVDDMYYMSSTTMHMAPGVPIMKSKDLVNWKLIGYAYDTLASNDALNLNNGTSAYGRGSWASCLRFHQGVYYITTFSQTTGKTHIFSCQDINKGEWKETSFSPDYHDHSLFFDDDGRVYMIYGSGIIKLIELSADLSGKKPRTSEHIVIENASSPAGSNIMLPSEGSQLFKINGRFYLFNIVWPNGGMRTVVVHRADKITGPYEGRVVLQDIGVAQGGLIDTPEGDWFAYLFRDYGAVGRIPYLVPVTWEDGWPVLGDEGKVPALINLPRSKGLIPDIVASDEFNRKRGDSSLPWVWQWNHNPDNTRWSLTKRKGFLRLETSRVDTTFLLARNTLTQRTMGPVCAGSTLLDVSNMKDGDIAGLAILQKKFGLIGVKRNGDKKFIVMVTAISDTPTELQTVPVVQDKVYLKIECDFLDKRDVATFFYSLDGVKWIRMDADLQMQYTLPHFMGYRFGLFNYATHSPGGFVDFDFFRIDDRITR